MLDDEGKMNNQDYGRIIFWGDRGYGFIRPDAGDRDVFVHVTEYELPEGEEMQLGDHVTYEVGADRRHPEKQCARLVRLERDEDKAPVGMYRKPIDDAVAGQALATWLTRNQ